MGAGGQLQQEAIYPGLDDDALDSGRLMNKERVSCSKRH